MSLEPAIQARGLSKRYRLGSGVGTGGDGSLRETIYDAVGGLVRRVRRREASTESRDLWALRGLSFDVAAGEVMGVIGHNGSGKSTLLKLLARVTDPTEGEAVVRGRVASLLEVGTGFHPELTGRENIYLSGAVLGMTRREVREKYDDIVAFSGVERFLDTPVKRYSSGMRVRLAFAVAAHLDPEVLIIDEVLAVGDIAFREKCLDKMRDLAGGHGRTVMFVSHNMSAIRGLCHRCLVLESGRKVFEGDPADAIRRYLDAGQGYRRDEGAWHAQVPEGVRAAVTGVRTLDERGRPADRFAVDQPVELEIAYRVLEPVEQFRLIIEIMTAGSQLAFTFYEDSAVLAGRPMPVGDHVARCRIPANLLNTDTHEVVLGIDQTHRRWVFQRVSTVRFEVIEASRQFLYETRYPGVVRPRIDWIARPVAAAA